MLEAMVIVVDGDFERPVYAEPEFEEVEGELASLMEQVVEEVMDGERRSSGTISFEESTLAFKVRTRLGVAFLALISDDVEQQDVTSFLDDVVRQYLDNVDDARDPDLDGVADLLLDVIPPWEE